MFVLLVQPYHLWESSNNTHGLNASSHLGNEMLSAVEKSSGLADVQVQMKKSAHADYGSCYNVGHCELSPSSTTLSVDACASVLVAAHGGAPVFNRTTIRGVT